MSAEEHWEQSFGIKIQRLPRKYNVKDLMVTEEDIGWAVGLV